MRAYELANLFRGRLIGDGDLELRSLACPARAGLGEISLLLWSKDIKAAKETKASLIVLPTAWAADFASELPATLIVIDDWMLVWRQLHTLLRDGLLEGFSRVERDIDHNAEIASTAQLARVKIGSGTSIAHYVVIDDDVVIGKNCRIEAGVKIHSRTVIGDSVSIGANSVIASSGFAPLGESQITNLPSLGSVRIDEFVRIGALCTIDCGLIGATSIGRYSQIDNQVHIGHDAYLGEEVVLAGQAGLAGFVELANGVSIGGQSGVVPHTKMGRGSRLSAKSLARGVVRDYEIWSGNPSMPHQIYLKDYAKKMRNYDIKKC